MLNAMQTAIIRKDLRGLVCNKRLFPVLLIVPLVFVLVLPTIFIFVVQFSPDQIDRLGPLLNLLPIDTQVTDIKLQIIGLLFNHILPIFFMIIPIMTASVMAASSFVGEKEKRTLETLLYCPLSLKQIYRAKVSAAFLLSMLVSLASFLVMIVVIEAETFFLSGSMVAPNLTWLATLLLIAPAISLIAISIIVRGSAKAQTVEEAQQRSAFLILPILLLIVGQFTGVLLVSFWLLLLLGVVFAVIAAFLFQGGIRRFSYESLLQP